MIYLRASAKPGSRGGGRFFQFEVRPSNQFVEFRVQDVGSPGGVERVARHRSFGSWGTAKWLVEKTHAHFEEDHFVPDSDEAKKLSRFTLTVTGSQPRRDIPVNKRLTPAMPACAVSQYQECASYRAVAPEG